MSGRAEITSPLTAPARQQLALRQKLAAQAADSYAEAGIAGVVQDLYLGEDLRNMVELVQHRPLYVVVLTPCAETLRQRESSRSKTGYTAWNLGGLVAAVEATPLDSAYVSTPATSASRKPSRPSFVTRRKPYHRKRANGTCALTLPPIQIRCTGILFRIQRSIQTPNSPPTHGTAFIKDVQAGIEE
ncbi:MAG TPA: hypothetical protein VN108_08000 [Marmoricola sp.]|nr:hypothetical protein [Marmoricola sp.]